MSFTSIAYAIFLPIVFCVYWRLQQKNRWIFILIASYFFYMSWNAKYIVLIILTTIVSFSIALLIEKTEEKYRKFVLILGAIICLAVLFIFKYYNFFINSIEGILDVFSIKTNIYTFNLILPVGISFYTFQTVGYIIDVYKKRIPAEKNIGVYAAFISFFPQLVAGPIERTENLLPQIRNPKDFQYEEAIYGLRLILWGFYKKIAIADTVAVYVDRVYDSPMTYKGFELAVASFFFTLQIYCDFSGYSDIAIGTAKLLGIKLMDNFRGPYLSKSIKEFWGRWHISLSTWFRDYVYIPLGGNRCSKVRHYFNIIITFLISGLWHGANWTFVLWGGVHGFLQIIEDVLNKPLGIIRKERIGKIFLVIITFVLCSLAWIFFRAESLTDAIYIILHMFDGFLDPLDYWTNNSIALTKWTFARIIVCILLVFLFDIYNDKKDVITWVGCRPLAVRLVIEYALIFIIAYSSFNNISDNQFVYFQF